MNIKITADSTCDLPAELVQRHGVSIIPLHIIKDGMPFTDGADITPDDIFAHVDAGGELCTTAAVSIGEYLDVFSPLAQAFDAVVHISLGAGFSSCYLNACLAAQSFSNVFVIDSHNLSLGQGQIVMHACRRAPECTDVHELCRELEQLAGRVESCFLLNRLDYLAKGGRCSSVVALGANLLRLKPCIEVSGGQMRVGKKYRGPYEKCVQEYVRDRLCGREDIETAVLFAPFTAQSQPTLQAFFDAVSHAKAGFAQVYHSPAGCTISCHCGPCTTGLMFVRKE